MADIDPTLVTRIAQGVEAAYDAIEEKGGTLPTEKNLDNLAATVGAMPTGITNYGTVKLTDDRTLTIQSMHEFLSMAENGYSYNMTIQGESVAQTLVKEVYLDEAVTALPDHFLYNCTNLTKVSAPGVIGTGRSVFNSQAKLTEVYLPKLQILGPQCFYNLQTFNQQVEFPELVKVADDCFYSMGTFNQPASFPKLVEAGANFFSQNTSFNSTLNIPLLTRVGDYFLRNCSSFNQEINFSQFESMGIHCLSNTAYNRPVTFDRPTWPNGLLGDCLSFNSPVTLTNNVKKIEEHFLYRCSAFNQDITIPASVNTVGGYFAQGWSNFQKVITFEGNAIGSSNNYSFSVTSTSVPAYTKGITVRLKGNNITWSQFTGTYPNRTSNPYRKLVQFLEDNVVLTDGTVVRFASTGDASALCSSSSASSSITIGGQSIVKNTIREVHIKQSISNAITSNYFCANCSNLTVLELPKNINNFKQYFLYNCTSFNQPLTFADFSQNSNSYFMAGCTSFNSALTFTNGLRTTAAGFLQGCTSFNQPLDFSNLTTLSGSALEGCVAFNQPINLSGVTTINSNTALLIGARDFTSDVIVDYSSERSMTNWITSSFSAANADAPIYTTGFTFKGNKASTYVGKFPNSSSGSVYRKVSSEVWPNTITIDTTSMLEGDTASYWFTTSPTTIDVPLTITSSDTSVVRIDGNQNLIAVGTGTATVTITCAANGRTANSTITVTGVPQTNYGILSYHSEWTDQWNCWGDNVEIAEIADENTLKSFIATNHIQSEGGGMGESYRAYYQQEWDPETGEPGDYSWVFYADTGNVEVAPENLTATTGLNVTLMDPEMGYATLDIMHDLQVDYSSETTTMTLSSIDDFNALCFDLNNMPMTITVNSTSIPVDAINGYTFGTQITTVGNGFFYQRYGYGDERMTMNFKYASNITTIGDHFMGQCRFNAPINLPNVTSIGDHFLENNSEFNSPITFGHLTTIGNSFMTYCQEFDQPLNLSTVQTIGTNFLNGCLAFNQPVDVTNITFATEGFLSGCNSLDNENIIGIHFGTAIGARFLSGCSKFNQNLDFSQVTSIGESFLAGTSYNQQINISSLTTLPNNFLVNCKSFNYPIDLTNITSIGQFFLQGCTSFNQNITWGGTTIPSYFLSNCSSFNSNVSFPNATTIGSSFLSSCSSFDKPLNIPNVTTVGASFLGYCTVFNQPLDGTSITTIGANFLEYCKAFNNTLPAVKVIPQYFLRGCTSFNRPIDLTQFTSVAAYFLYGCSSFNQTLDFSEVTYTPPMIQALENYDSPYICKKNITSVNYLISDCKKFNQPITLPSTVTRITGGIISSCKSWNQDFTFPATITSMDGGIQLFRNCDAMTSTYYFETNKFPSYSYTWCFTASSATAPAFTEGIIFGGTYASDALSKWGYNASYYRNPRLAS